MIWIVTASPFDARPLARALGGDMKGIEMGAGPACANGALDQAFAQYGAPDWVVHAGFASAAQPGIPAGLLLFDVWGEATEARDLAKQVASETGHPYQLGPIRSPERPLTTTEEKLAFGREKRALAVDRENEAVRDWARRHSVPSLAVKVAFDAPPGDAGLLGTLRDLPAYFEQRRALRTLTGFLQAFAPRLPVAAPHA